MGTEICRESVFILWIIIITICFVLKHLILNSRKPLKMHLYNFFKNNIKIVVILILAFIFCITYPLSKLEIWEFSHITNTAYNFI